MQFLSSIDAVVAEVALADVLVAVHRHDQPSGTHRALFNSKRIGMATQTTTAQTDPICGMQVDPIRAAGSSEHAGETYYFCSFGCKARFDKNPAEFTQAARPQGTDGCCGG